MWFIVYLIEGLHTFRSLDRPKLFISLVRANTINVFLSTFLFYNFSNEHTPKLILVIHTLLVFISTGLWRYFVYSLFAHFFQRRAILIGPQISVEQIRSYLEKHPQKGFKIQHSFTYKPSIEEIKPYLDGLKKEDVVAVSRKFINDSSLLDLLYSVNVNLLELSAYSERITKKVQVESLEVSWFLEHCWFEKQHGFQKFIKDAFDKIIASIAIIILFVPFSLLLFVLLFISGRPIFFTQKRIGRRGHLFNVFKLRTMKLDAEKDGAQWAKEKDSRVTSIGSFLRKTRLDEIPQLWNVIRGEMSIVGPRPERPEFLSRLKTNLPFYNERHLMRPGITGWAQVNYRYGASEEDALEKLKYDLFYIKNQSFLLDLYIIVKTVKVMLSGLGQ